MWITDTVCAQSFQVSSVPSLGVDCEGFVNRTSPRPDIE